VRTAANFAKLPELLRREDLSPPDSPQLNRDEAGRLPHQHPERVT